MFGVYQASFQLSLLHLALGISIAKRLYIEKHTCYGFKSWPSISLHLITSIVN